MITCPAHNHCVRALCLEHFINYCAYVRKKLSETISTLYIN